MKRSREVIELPILSISDGMQIGTVKDLFINPQEKNVEFILLDEKENASSELRGFPYLSAEAVGDFAVTVKDAHGIIDIMKVSILKKLADMDINVIGTKVITKKGMFLGNVTEYELELDKGNLKYFYFQMEEDNTEKVISVDNVITIGKEALIIEEDYQSVTEKQKSNFKEGNERSVILEKKDEENKPLATKTEDQDPDTKAEAVEEAPVTEEKAEPVLQEEVPAAEAAPVEEEAPAVEEAPVTEEKAEPVLQEEPVVEEVKPAAEAEPEAPVQEEVPAAEAAPVEEEAPAVEEAPVTEEKAEPVLQEEPAAEEVKPAAEAEPEAPVQEEVPAAEAAPVEEEVPAVEEAPVTEEKAEPVLQEEPAAEEVKPAAEAEPETPVQEEVPAAEAAPPVEEEVPAVEETPVTEEKAEPVLQEEPAAEEKKEPAKRLNHLISQYEKEKELARKEQPVQEEKVEEKVQEEQVAEIETRPDEPVSDESKEVVTEETEDPGKPEEGGQDTERSTVDKLVEQQKQYVLGKTLIRDIKTDSGDILAKENEKVTEELFLRLYNAGPHKIVEAMTYVKD